MHGRLATYDEVRKVMAAYEATQLWTK